MRTILTLLALAAPVLALAETFQLGDRVSVVEDAPITRDNEPVGRAGVGWVYIVGQVDGDKIWVNGSRAGWLECKHVIPLDRAVAYFHAQLEKNEDPAQAVGAMAIALTAMGKFDSAINLFSELLRQYPTEREYWNNRGVAWMRKQSFDNAIADYTEAIVLDESDATAWCNRADAKREKGQPEEAIPDYDTAIRLDEADAMAFNGRGQSWAATKNFERAINDFDQAIRLNPRLGAAYLNRGNAYWYSKKLDEALRDYTSAIRLDPKDQWAYLDRGDVYGSKGQFADAIADFKEGIRLAPGEPWACNQLAWLLSTCPDAAFRDGTKAVGYATKACEIAAWQNGNLLDTLAASYAEAGKFAEAVQWQTKSIDLSAKDDDMPQRLTRLELYKQQQPFHFEAEP